MEMKERLFPVKADGKLSVAIFAIVSIVFIGSCFLSRAIFHIEDYALRCTLNLLQIAIDSIAIAVVAMKLTSQERKLLPTKRRLWLQILIGFGLAAVLCLIFRIIPILCGQSFPGSYKEMPLSEIIFYSVKVIIFVGIGEEVLFRGYIQNQFEIWLKKFKWLAPLIAAILFGLCHFINGTLQNVLAATFCGCVFGYSKFSIKDCTLLSVIIAHGMYDFSLMFLTGFIL